VTKQSRAKRSNQSKETLRKKVTKMLCIAADFKNTLILGNENNQCNLTISGYIFFNSYRLSISRLLVILLIFSLTAENN